MEWISVKDRLPDEGKYVVVRHNRGTWHDSTDQENVNCVVAKLVIGLSQEEREKMKAGLMPENTECGWCLSDGWTDTPRYLVYKREDEHFNNKKPYCWNTFGPNSFNGQEITHWMPLPEPPKEEIK